eukprot:gene7960-8818_t
MLTTPLTNQSTGIFPSPTTLSSNKTLRRTTFLPTTRQTKTRTKNSKPTTYIDPRQTTKGGNQTTVITITAVSAVAFIVLCLVIVILCARKKRTSGTMKVNGHKQTIQNTNDAEMEIYDDVITTPTRKDEGHYEVAEAYGYMKETKTDAKEPYCKLGNVEENDLYEVIREDGRHSIASPDQMLHETEAGQDEIYANCINPTEQPYSNIPHPSETEEQIDGNDKIEDHHYLNTDSEYITVLP